MTFANIDYLKAINLFGLNVSTYKPALLRCIINFSRKGLINIDWGDLSEEFLKNKFIMIGLQNEIYPSYFSTEEYQKLKE